MDNQQPVAYQAPVNQTVPPVGPGSPVGSSIWRSLIQPKTIFIILGVVIAVELVWGITTFLTPPPKTARQLLQPQSLAKIVLIANKTTVKVGETVAVRARVMTGGHPTSGTDLVLRFNRQVLSASESSIIKGTIYDDYPLISVDNNAGVVRISGVKSTTGSNSFNGIADFATINFNAQAKGTSELAIDMVPGLTNESNVIEVGSNADILQSVTNLTINVR